MRPLLALVLGVSIFSVVGVYLNFANNIKPPPINFDEEGVSGQFSLELEATFDAQASEFDLKPTSVVVKFRGTEIIHESEKIAAGTVLRVSALEEMKAGKNEFNLKINGQDSATGSDSEPVDDFSFSLDAPVTSKPTGAKQKSSTPRAARLRVFKADKVIGEAIFWADANRPLEGTLLVTVAGKTSAEQDGSTHEH